MGDEQTLWLNVANAVLGITVAACLVSMVLRLALYGAAELYKQWKMRAEAHRVLRRLSPAATRSLQEPFHSAVRR